jgi:4-hydroxy-tetrahydrodipicolinate reductase
VDRAGGDVIGQDLGVVAGHSAIGKAAGDDADALIAACNVVIDFTSPGATAEHCGVAAKAGTAMVVGTTGLEPGHEAALVRASQSIPIMRTANMSAAVTLMMALIEQVARTLDDSYDIEIVEMHHRHKVDAPSGTALALGRAAAEGRGVSLGNAQKRGRDGITGARPRGEIGFAALRGGDVAGDHTVVFATEGERLEVTHKASSRRIFATGAVRAAKWIAGRPPGLYGMTDVLGLSGG